MRAALFVLLLVVLATIPPQASASHAAGTYPDESGNGHLLTLTNAAVTTGLQGQYGEALDVNAGGFAVANGAALNVTRITVALWVKPDALGTVQCLICRFSTAPGWYFKLAANGSYRFAGPNIGVDDYWSTAALSAGTWTHVAVTYDQTNVRLYKDGAPVGVYAQTAAISSTGDPLRVAEAAAGVQPYLGLQDDVRLYSEAVSDSDLDAIINQTAPVTSNLRALYTFDEDYLASLPGAGLSSCSDVTIPVASTRDFVWPAPDTLPRCYGFSLVSTVFDQSAPIENVTGPLNLFAVAANHDYGAQSAAFYFGFERREIAKGIVEYLISNTTTTRTIRVETLLYQQNAIGLTVTPPVYKIEQSVYNDGELHWSYIASVGAALLQFGGLRDIDFRTTSLVGWAQDNMTVFENHTLGDGIVGSSKEIRFAEYPPRENHTNVLFWVPFDTAASWFGSEGDRNGTQGFDSVSLPGCSICPDIPDPRSHRGSAVFSLGSMSNVSGVSVVTTYPLLDAETLDLHYQFLTKPARNLLRGELEDRCGFLAGLVRLVFGFCPTVQGLAIYLGEKVGGLTTILFSAVASSDEVAEGAGTVTGLLFGAYTFGFFLILLDPISLFLVVMGHVWLVGCINAGLQGDFRILGSSLATGLRWTGKISFYYVLATWFVLKFAWDMGSKLLHIMVQGVRS